MIERGCRLGYWVLHTKLSMTELRGLIGRVVVGAVVGAVVDIIIGAIDGAREKKELEARAAELQEALDKLVPEVSNLQTEVTSTMLKIVQQQGKSPNLQ